MDRKNPFIELAANGKAAAVEDPVKVAAALRQAASSDKAPTAQQFTQATPLASLDQLTTRFDVTRIPISRLKQMQRDPMIAFALFFIRAQLMRARWVIECPDPQVAAFVDNALREIYPGLISQFLMKLVYGFQPVVKRFALARPDWTYADSADQTNPTKLVWEEGSIEAIIWKPFVALPPQTAEPIWATDGSFDGIKYKPVATGSGGSSGGSSKEQEFDVLHALWFSNEKETVHGSLYGYPRIGYAFRFWWSFWFNWGLADRHFEKDADPPAIVYYPSSKPDLRDPVTNEVISRRQMALNIGDKARSNSTIALPSDPVVADDGSVKTMREWEITFAKGGGNFAAFKDRFDQLQVMILRSVFVPEQAFLEGQGGTSSRNVAGELQEAFVASQIVLMQEFDFDLNRYVIPQLVMANFADRQVKAKKVTKGFDVEDIAFAKQIIQLIGQNDPSQLEADVPSLMESVGLPRLSPEAISRRQAEIAAQAGAAPPPETPPVGGNAGINQQGLYYADRPQLTLSTADNESESAFLAELHEIGLLKDPLVMMDARRLREVWRAALAYDYVQAIMLVGDYGDQLTLDEKFFERWIRRAKNKAQDTVSITRRVLASIMRRSSTVAFDEARINDFSWDPLNDEAASRYLSERSAELIDGITNTTRQELRDYLVELVNKGIPHRDIPHFLRAKFDMFSGWRADRIAKTEIAYAYNMGVLLAARDAGIKQVQIRDGLYGPPRSDAECIARNGKIVTLAEAFRVLDEEHPNGTLQFRIPKRKIRIKFAQQFGGILASYDPEIDEVIFAESLSEEERNKYLLGVVDKMNSIASP